jgi:hypothetical protein
MLRFFQGSDLGVMIEVHSDAKIHVEEHHVVSPFEKVTHQTLPVFRHSETISSK